MWQSLLEMVRKGDMKALARAISLVENSADGYQQIMKELPHQDDSTIIGVTGPPGAGKSSLVDLIIGAFIEKKKKIAVICVDPSSPFNHGAVLGDRIRMSEWYNHPSVYIRSLATRGSLGGLNPRIIEITDLLKDSAYDIIIIETVGVGQSEVEIAGLADTTIVVLVPEAGDEIQTMKAGIMEIADIFVVNKSDRPSADQFVMNLRTMVHSSGGKNIPVIKTSMVERTGLEELMNEIEKHESSSLNDAKKTRLLAERAYTIIGRNRMRNIQLPEIEEAIMREKKNGNFNLYKFVENY